MIKVVCSNSGIALLTP
ncbi:hypothetical protein O4N84_22155 [Vibrio parahaemolyticus]|nr:hypothetical protein [Vibrio parahaemolyticus]MCZ6395109.1 hypothetical protein [Vibrio parahaemolyticus]MDZ5120876.1 hypothetical protein [Vibrio parahaemolyticus]